ncbi:serine/threonine protein phosphatase [Methylophaga sp. SB9B]|uniref:metallophosphoesterase family protein n=1 Tax=Methylophaga sp. SB9B TaxID=2570356 RepID=UPI0010A9284E|nr:metallophosphoesterase [Methylophaga sp. SB9B]THK41818.1 serine/threonine protein phosphatase [Methylophaga sp. SB9B]
MKLLSRLILSTALLLSVVFNTGCSTEPDNTKALSFVVLGDAEPKPEAKFPHMAAAIADINQLIPSLDLEFAVGVGDIAHKGTMLQYEQATPVLQALNLPFYPIMGNEEYGSTTERFLTFANLWNQGKTSIDSIRYTKEFDSVALVFASPDFGRDFNDEGIDWLKNEVARLSPKPVMLVVHGAQQGVFKENADKGISHPGFVTEVISQPNVRAVISGDLHMDMPRVNHSLELNGVHYVHIPALERTKIPDESHHVAMYRVFSVMQDGSVVVDTYQTGNLEPLADYQYRFTL